LSAEARCRPHTVAANFSANCPSAITAKQLFQDQPEILGQKDKPFLSETFFSFLESLESHQFQSSQQIFTAAAAAAR
jgi:hypothetical protein